MNSLSLVTRELRHRWPGALLGTLVVGIAVALVVVSLALARAGEKETRLIQRDVGLNLLILSDKTDMADYWARGYSDHSFPAEYMDRVHDQAVANRLVPLLKQRVEVSGVSALLVGIEGERFKGGQVMKPVFGKVLASGQAVLGGAVARLLDVAPGESLTILGHEANVQTCLSESGTVEDGTIYVPMQDAQAWLGMAGRINEIQALECHCGKEVEDPLGLLREVLAPLLPGTIVLRRQDAADARRNQRQLAEGTLALLSPLFVLLAGALVAVLGVLNVRDRREELGVYGALGHSPWRVAMVLLGRPAVIGCTGALAGCALGEALTQQYGPGLFTRAVVELHSGWPLWLGALLVTPVFALIASLPATLWSLRQDPVRLLRHG
ncbi:MAG: ABC transporter permease [Planctomycetota bacterium]|nr:ABC transporter permease [Planctomycetota bacterium]